MRRKKEYQPGKCPRCSETLLSVSIVAQKLRVTRAAVAQMLSGERLTGSKVGQTWVITEADFNQFLADWSGPKRRRK